ncbi:MAG: molybdopterin-dependent oxidoreductase [Desulfovibrio sp.]|jgi:thiosulfate reductase/polysulfide reductase chain A|nr:molybdopterin-dependent oxidoreductase [Desulfovibrio sp.]
MSAKHHRLSRRAFLKSAAATGIAAVAAEVHARGKDAPIPDASEVTDPKAYENVFTACDMCFNRCAVIARVNGEGQDRKILKLDPNPKCSKSRGMLCARGNAGVALINSPDRLTRPLLRTGPRGGNLWRPISWEEALDRTAQAMREIGARYSRCGMLFTAGADTQSRFVHRFAEAYGSFNITSHESLCLLSVNRAFMDTFGEVPQVDLLHCDHIVMLGANRFESLVMPDSADLMQAVRRGAKLVVLDPRCTKTAEAAAEWHAIRPGTDLAFLLALCRVILEEDLYDRAWIESNTHGLEALRAHVASCTPAWAEQETGIKAAHIVRAARELAAAAPRAVVYPGRRSSDYEDSTQIRRGFAVVNALLANFDRPGGLMSTPAVKLRDIPFEAPWFDDNPADRVDAGRVPLLFNDEGSFVLTRDAVLSGQPYPVKGWFIYKTNPMGTAPDREKTAAMMRSLDFIVSVDIMMSDTAFMSDIVLPAPCYLERDDPLFVLQGGPAGPCILTRNRVVPPPGECRPVFDVVKALAGKLDIGNAFDFTLHELRERQLESFPGLKTTLEEDGVFEPSPALYGLKKGRPYKTPSGRIELYSTLYQQKGLDPLPVYTPPAAVPADSFVLVAGRTACITQTQSQNNRLLAEFAGTNTLWIHPAAAARLGIGNGDEVTVRSSVGTEHLRAELTKGIRPDTVYMHSGFGALASGPGLAAGTGASIAALFESAYDALCGNAALHTTRVTVQRREGAA